MLPLESLQKILDSVFPGLMGVRLVEVTPERVVAELAVRADLCTTGGILHGGAYMAFADTLGAVGTFVNLPEGKRTTTTDSSTKFIGGAAVGTTVVGECVGIAPRQDHASLANHHPVAARQAVRRRDADAARARSGSLTPPLARSQYVPGSRMPWSTVLMSVRPQNAIDRSSSLWMISSALVTPASPIAPSP